MAGGDVEYEPLADPWAAGDTSMAGRRAALSADEVVEKRNTARIISCVARTDQSPPRESLS